MKTKDSVFLVLSVLFCIVQSQDFILLVLSQETLITRLVIVDGFDSLFVCLLFFGLERLCIK